ncbi:MAG: trypsin-like serine protease [Rhodobacterales bacterium]|nr:trypsin-like serine protease [Rhodobacterales bacterium]
MKPPSVVRIYSTAQEPNYHSPWNCESPSHTTGSGVVLASGQILTGAHVVADATFLQAQKVSDPDKYTARVIAICHDSDLALLEVIDPKFQSDITAATLGPLPNLQDRVSVIGYPVGGEEISITEGVVSRVEVQVYSHSQRRLLAVTVDAAINDGNSGGPVVRDNKVVGIAFQSLSDAENIGEMVPTPVIRQFLEGISSGKEPALPDLGIAIQTLENPVLRRKLGLRPGDSGVRVAHVAFGSSCDGHLLPGDALLSIEGLPIANNGTVSFRGRFRTRLSVVLSERWIGDSIDLVVLREGREIATRVTLCRQVRLVPQCRYDVEPSYFIYGGLVLQPLTRNYLQTWTKWRDKAPKAFVTAYYSGHRTEERQQMVVVSQVLADELNIGYVQLYDDSVAAINDVVPRDLAHAVALLRERRTGLVQIRMSSGSVAVFDAQEVAKADAKIMATYHIPQPSSRPFRR